MTIYLSGPMRGVPQFNFPAFFEAEQRLRDLGHTVINPARHDEEMYPDIASWEGFDTGNIDECSVFDIKHAIMWDLEQVAECDAIAMLPGWQSSIGARIERDLAMLLKHPVLDARTGEPYQETVFEEAERIVNGARKWNYGTARDNHSRTAELWGAYLGVEISAREVCWLNILQKASRDAHAPIRDNVVDTAGYARNIELLED